MNKITDLFIFICKAFYYNGLQKELNNSDYENASSTYQRTNFTKGETLDNHRSVLSSFGVHTKDVDMDLPSLYWIPKLHKDPYKRFIAGSSNCSTKPLSKILTSILTTVKDGLKKYCDVIYSHSGSNQMWILQNSKELLDNLQSYSLSSIHSIKHMIFQHFTLLFHMQS